jgi:hypothetical protein
MLREFRDPDGETIHYIALGQEDSIKSEWTEIERVERPAMAIELPYFLKRAREYPPISDQLDMIWHMMDNETIPGKGSDWYNAILAVKNTYPKP